MKKSTLQNIGKIQVTILTIILILCWFNNIPLSLSFSTYFITALAFLSFVSFVLPDQEQTNQQFQPENHNRQNREITTRDNRRTKKNQGAEKQDLTISDNRVTMKKNK